MSHKRLPVFIVGLIMLASLTSCQNPANQPPTAPETPKLVLAGYVIDELGQYTAGQWVDGQWQAISGETDTFANTIVEHDGAIYAAGYTLTIGNTRTACMWIDGEQQPLPLPENAQDSIAKDICVINDHVLVAGYYSYTVTIEGYSTTKRDCGYWIDGSWQPATVPAGVARCYANGLAELNGSILMCGYSGSSAFLWTDGICTELERPDGYTYIAATQILVDDENVYCAGFLIDSSNYCKPCVWKNGIIEVYEVPDGMTDGYIDSIAIRDGEITAVGDSETTNDEGATLSMIPGYWKAGIWNPLTLAPGSSKGLATAIIVSENIITGYCMDGSGRNIPGFWKSGSWNAVSLPTEATHGIILDGLSVSGPVAATQDSPSSKLVVLTAGSYNREEAIMAANGKALVEDSSACYATGIAQYGDDVYFSGTATLDANSVGDPVYWKNGARVDLALPEDAWGDATDIQVVDTFVYVAGYITQHTESLPVDSPCVWINGTRTALTTGNTLGGQANRLAVVGGDVYISGYWIESTGDAGDTRTICFWKNSTRTDIESIAECPDEMVFGIASSGNDVYVCGSSADELGKLIPAYWKVSDPSLEMTTLDAGEATKAGCIDLLLANGSVHAVGTYHDATDGWMPAYWKDGVLSTLETEYSETNDYQVGISLALDGSDVYIAGMRSYSTEGEVPTLWKNGKLIALAGGNNYGSMLDIAIKRY
ncbi:MAG: hypothetical protein A2Y38_24745 [Spirochaetes bacterium GWB1_59_5]|nr:MAG: hypothetical protein A2Y38_24745 [Spirochaetes bacterium GWB1_59_5]